MKASCVLGGETLLEPETDVFLLGAGVKLQAYARVGRLY